MTKLTFKNAYNGIGKKEEFFINRSEGDQTDQSQIYTASLREMAKRFGIDALYARAEQLNATEGLKNALYGIDLTTMSNTPEEQLNVKKQLIKNFEKIPARIRKTEFGDNIGEFIQAYTSNDESKLEMLNKYGIVSTTQLENVKEANRAAKAARKEELTKIKFAEELNKIQGDLYEKFKETGNISINNIQNNADSNKNILDNI